ncbi:MAG: Fur family transcriptional regulator [Victivallaceae bacterium]
MNRTVQRSALLDELQQSGLHLTADELYLRLREKVPQISLATIYRNLEELAERGIIGKVESAGRPKRFEARTGGHYHCRCRGCGELFDMPEDSAAKLKRFFAGFLPSVGCDSVKIEFDGCCRSCLGRRETSDDGNHNQKRGPS